jgi:xanthine/uracil permease
MKQEVSPPVVIGVIVLVVAIALGLIYMRGKGTSEQAMQQVQQGKSLYQPPPGAPIPGAPPAR